MTAAKKTATKAPASKVDELLNQFSFADTIDYKCPTTGVTITVAEAHPLRNPAYGKAFADVMAQRKDLDQPLEQLTFTLQERVRLFCEGCLRAWDYDLPVESAPEILLSKNGPDDTRGEKMLQAWEFPTRMATSFKAAYGKKKPSPKPGTSKGSTATSRTPSKPKRKPAAKRSPKR